MSVAMLYGIGGDNSSKELVKQLIERTLTSLSEKELKGCTLIGRDAFFGALSLTSVYLTDNITRIEFEGFFNASNIEVFVIGNGVSFIGNNALRGLTSLQKFIVKRDTPPTTASNTWFQNSTGYIYVPYSSVNVYRTATNWTQMAAKIYPLVETISGLQDIDTSLYTRACVIGNNEYTEYVYDGNQWAEV